MQAASDPCALGPTHAPAPQSHDDAELLTFVQLAKRLSHNWLVDVPLHQVRAVLEAMGPHNAFQPVAVAGALLHIQWFKTVQLGWWYSPVVHVVVPSWHDDTPIDDAERREIAEWFLRVMRDWAHADEVGYFDVRTGVLVGWEPGVKINPSSYLLLRAWWD